MMGCMLFHIIDHFSIFLFSPVFLQTFHPYIMNFVVVQSNIKLLIIMATFHDHVLFC
jgi:hypothetical protein